jgi:predicted SAM-dependent methyltransferase
MRRELVIGCGSRIQKDLSLQGMEAFQELVTLDNNKSHFPDVLWDLRKHPLPFKDNEFDEIHAYDVLEHLAYQGDYEFFFSEFSEYWRILKHRGHLFATVPLEGTQWSWGDPSHKRVITRSQLAFLNQKLYSQVGTTQMSDFRNIYKADFKIVHLTETNNKLSFILEAIKNEDTSPTAELQDNGYSRCSVPCFATS